MHEQLAGATSRLDQTERTLDLERATRDDIIKAEVAKQVAELVRMFLTQKRERFIISEDDRTTVHEQILASIEETDEDKERYKMALSILKEHRLKQAACSDRGTQVCNPHALLSSDQTDGEGRAAPVTLYHQRLACQCVRSTPPTL